MCGPRREGPNNARGIDSRLVGIRRRKHWGWGFEDQQLAPDAAPCHGRARGGAHRHPRLRGRGARAAGGRDARSLRAFSPPPRWPRSARRTPTPAPRTRWGSPTRTWSGDFEGASIIPPTSSPARARRASWRPCSSGARAPASRRSPTGVAARSSVASRPRSRVTTTVRSRSTWGLRPRARARHRVGRRADPGRRPRPRPRGPARRARADPAPLPPVVRALDPRRLDRHPGGGTFRDPVDAHRGLPRVGPRAHPDRRVGVAAAARIGSGGEPRSHARRLGGHARRDHRGVGAGAPASTRTAAPAAWASPTC